MAIQKVNSGLNKKSIPYLLDLTTHSKLRNPWINAAGHPVLFSYRCPRINDAPELTLRCLFKYILPRNTKKAIKYKQLHGFRLGFYFF